MCVFVFFLIFLFSSKLSQVKAATLYWVGNDGANASVASNWKTTNPASCGSGDASAIPGASDDVNFDADCDNGAVIDSSFSSTVATVTITSGYSGTITLSNPLTVSSTATFNAGTFTCSSSGSLTMTSTLTVSGGIVNLGSCTTTDMNGGLTVSSGSFTAPTGTMTVAGTLSISNSTFNANGGTITIDGSGSANVGCANVTLNLVTFAHTNSTKTVNANCNVPVGNNPTFTTTGASVTLNGTLTGTGTLTTVSTFTINAGGALSGFSGLSVAALTVAGGTVDLSGYSSYVASSITTLSSGSLNLPTGADLNAGLVISGGTFTAPSGTMTLAGSLTVSGGTGTFNANGGTITFDGSTATIGCTKSDSSVISFNSVTIPAGSGTKTVSSGCILPLGSNPTIGIISLSGTLTGTGTLNYGNTSVVTINSTGVLSGFSGLSFTNGGFTVSGATLDLTNYNPVTFTIFTISSGTFTAPTGVMTVNNNFTHSGGTFNHNNGTVIFNSRNITGSTTFFNFTKTVTAANTLTLSANSTQTIQGTLIIKGGGSGSRLSLRSSSTGSQWYINATGGRVLNNLDVQDSNGIGNSYICSSCIDSGNNTNWTFINGSSIQFSLDSPSGNSHITNLNPTYRWSKASVSNNSAVTKYELYIQPKDNSDNNIGTALYIDNIAPFVSDNKQYQYNPTYTLYDDGDYLNLTPNNYILPLGKYNFRIVAHDSAGNIAENSNNFWVESDIFKPSYSNTKGWFPLQINSISGSNQKGVISSFGLPSTSQNQTTLTISTTTPTIKGIAFSNSTITLTITDQKTKQTKTYTTKAVNSRFTLTPTITTQSYINISVSDLSGKYTQLPTLTLSLN